MFSKNKISLSVALALGFSSMPALADFNFSGSLVDANEVKTFQLEFGQGGTNDSADPGGSISIQLTTDGFVPFLAMAQEDTPGSSFAVTEIASNASASGSNQILNAAFNLRGDQVLAQNIILLSQQPNTVAVGDDAFVGWTAGASVIVSGQESFFMEVFGAPTSFILSGFTASGQTQVIDTFEDHHDIENAETTVENINNAQLSNQITTVRTTYTKNIRALSRGGVFSIANANYAVENGINAGDSGSGMAFWFTPTYTDLKNTATINKNGHFDGSQESYLFGLDVVMSSDLVVGALVGFEKSETDSKDNSESDTDGYILSAYMAYNLGSGFAARAHIGYNNSDTDIEDRTIFGATASYDGDYDSDSVFAGFGVMRTSELDNGMFFTMDLGYDYGDTDSDSYTASLSTAPTQTLRMNGQSSHISEFSLNMELANPMGWGEIYGTTGVVWDLTHSDSTTLKDDGEIGLSAGFGARFNASDNLQGEISYNKVVIREGIGDYTISANLRYNF